MRLIFDLETNGLLDELTLVHSLCMFDLDSGKSYSFHSEDDIERGVHMLDMADEIIGHNIIGFDVPALTKVYPSFNPRGDITDTLVLSRLVYADIKQDDFGKKYPELPTKLYGSHSLKAWGLRLNCLKGDYEGGWESWSEEMQKYCEQDVTVTTNLYNFLDVKSIDPLAFDLEHRAATLCAKIGGNGFVFNEIAASELYAELAQRRADLDREMKTLFEDEIIEETFVPKVNNSKLGYQKGVPFIKRKVVEFNPASRKMIGHRLRKKYSWKPTQWTPSGDPKIDETVLSGLPYPEAKRLAEYFLLQKRIGQLAEGRQAWLKSVGKDGKVRHSINSNGTVTGRASHSHFNIAQVPATRAPWGRECRELFTVPPGWELVGADLEGLELRCLAHYLWRFDDGAYAKELLEGDIHTANQEAAGLPTRDNAKTFIYAWLYGAGDEKIGKIIGKGRKEGKIIKDRFLAAFPAVASLKRAVTGAAQRGYLKGLDNRKLTIRSEHSALNTLLQSAGAVLCKQWIVESERLLTEETNLRHGWNGDFVFCAWVHDELQIAVRKGLADDIGNRLKQSAEEAGKIFGFRCETSAGYSVGTSWADTH